MRSVGPASGRGSAEPLRVQRPPQAVVGIFNPVQGSWGVYLIHEGPDVKTRDRVPGQVRMLDASISPEANSHAISTPFASSSPDLSDRATITIDDTIDGSRYTGFHLDTQ